MKALEIALATGLILSPALATPASSREASSDNVNWIGSGEFSMGFSTQEFLQFAAFGTNIRHDTIARTNTPSYNLGAELTFGTPIPNSGGFNNFAIGFLYEKYLKSIAVGASVGIGFDNSGEHIQNPMYFSPRIAFSKGDSPWSVVLKYNHQGNDNGAFIGVRRAFRKKK